MCSTSSWGFPCMTTAPSRGLSGLSAAAVLSLGVTLHTSGQRLHLLGTAWPGHGLTSSDRGILDESGELELEQVVAYAGSDLAEDRLTEYEVVGRLTIHHQHMGRYLLGLGYCPTLTLSQTLQNGWTRSPEKLMSGFTILELFSRGRSSLR